MRSRFARLCALMLALLVIVFISGCAGQRASTPNGADGQAETQDPNATGREAPPQEGAEQLYTPSYQPNGNETAVIKTNKGTIEVELYGKDAPIHVGNFVELVDKGFYDNTKFHRYEPGFVIQGGDPQTKDLTSAEVVKALQTRTPPLGTGGPGYTIKGEFDSAQNPNKHVEGALGMARSQSPDSAGSQFYFTLAPAPFLDSQYTVFGKITKGLDIMKELRVGDEIESVTIQGASK